MKNVAQNLQNCEPIYQFRKAGSGCPEWHDGHPDPTDGGGPYETRTLYTAPPKREPLSDEQIERALTKLGKEANLRGVKTRDAYALAAIYVAELGIGGQS